MCRCIGREGREGGREGGGRGGEEEEEGGGGGRASTKLHAPVQYCPTHTIWYTPTT